MTTRPRIFIVADPTADLSLLTGILAQRDYLVQPFPDSARAVSAAQAEPPDLMLLDVRPAGLAAPDVCAQWQADERTRGIPVILLDAPNQAGGAPARAATAGAADYLTRPFHAEEVLARVETHLTLRQLRQQVEDQQAALAAARQELKATQDQFIQREKMVMLGHLLAGLAHEINTPLGAIQASVVNIMNALTASFQQFPILFRQLAPECQETFFALIQTALENKARLSTREARAAKRTLQAQLLAQDIQPADTLTNLLANLGLYQDFTPFLTLLRHPRNTLIFQNAYHLFMAYSNSRNIGLAVERAAKLVLALKSQAHHDYAGQKSHTDVVEGLELTLTLYAHQLKKGVTVTKDYRAVPFILAYPDELNQVWSNLIQNAIQAMTGQGTLEIAVFRQTHPLSPPQAGEAQHFPPLAGGLRGGFMPSKPENLTALGPGGEFIVVRITDSGPGIPPEVHARMFEPFFTTKPAGEGSGLGLHIVRRIIDRHQGRIEVESQPGRTTFSVFLPVEVRS